MIGWRRIALAGSGSPAARSATTARSVAGLVIRMSSRLFRSTVAKPSSAYRAPSAILLGGRTGYSSNGRPGAAHRLIPGPSDIDVQYVASFSGLEAVRSAIRSTLKKIRTADKKEVIVAEMPRLFSMLDKAAQGGKDYSTSVGQ